MPSQKTPLHLLIIDDEAAFTEALAERLRLRGFSVATAGNGPEGLREALRRPPDVVVLDLRLPGMDGMDVLRNLKKINTYLPVIMLTGHGDPRAQVLSSRLAAHSYNTKPLDIDRLVEKIHAAFHDRQEYARLALRLAAAEDNESTRHILEEERKNMTNPLF